MQAARSAAPGPREGATLPLPSVPAPSAMDRDFIARNQIVERYLSGRLPLMGAQDFERYCREHPDLLDEMALPERLNAALRLMEAGGRAPPWELPAKRWWERPPALIAAAGLALILGITALALYGRLGARDAAVAALQRQVAARPVDPIESTHTYAMAPNRTAPSQQSLATIGGARAELAELQLDVAWSQFSAFRIVIDRIDQGRVLILHHVLRDSSGALRIGLNTSTLGPGVYRFTIEGLTWRGEAVPQAWATITIAH